MIDRVVLIVGCILAAGCGGQLPGKPNPNDRPIPAEDVLEFDVLYARNCAGCHGADGTRGPAPPLNDPLFRAIVPEQELVKVLKEGRKQDANSTPMPPFAHSNGGPLSEVQVEILVNQIKGVPYDIVKLSNGRLSTVQRVTPNEGIAPRWGKPPTPPASVPPILLPKTPGSADKGSRIFAQACAMCHGKDGRGILGDEKRLNKINDQAFLKLISDQELRRIIITGRSDLKMPSFSEGEERSVDFQPLTSTDIADLNALLSEWRNGRTVPKE